jgi:histidinol dehydrogenase
LVKVLDAREASSKEIAAQLRRPGGFLSEKVRDDARRIVADIRDRRDEALLEYTERFDGVRPDPVRVPPEEIREARNAPQARARPPLRDEP